MIETILVEDKRTIQATLIPALKELCGVVVIAIAETATEGAAALRSHPSWRLAIVDLFLGEGNGLEVLRSCAERSAAQKVVVLSNYATGLMRQRCLELGANAVFDKSTELEEFIDFCVDVSNPG